MKKFIAVAILALFTAACTQTGSQSGAMCEKCSCCQEMMKDGRMQCPMMQGNKDGKPCACCQGMMEGSMKEGMQCPMMQDGKPCSCFGKMMQNQSTKPVAKKASKPATVTDEDHKQHHLTQ